MYPAEQHDFRRDLDAAINLAKQRRHRDAIARFEGLEERAHHLPPTSRLRQDFQYRYCRTLTAYAQTFARKRHYAQAERYFEQALHINPNDAQMAITLTGYGNVLAQQGRYEEAAARFEQALHINPNDATTLTNYGHVLAQQGRYEEAAARFEQALHINPENATTLTNYGNVLAQQGRYEEAAARFEQALHINPNDAITLASYATALVNQGRWADANQRFEEALKIDASNAQTLTNYADALAQQGRYEEAAARFEQALHINPENATTLTNYGNVLAQQGRYEEAAARFEQALHINPNDAITLASYATALVNQGRWADANQRFEEALKIDASNAQTLTNYADALAQQGRYEEAAARFEQALHINPNDAITLASYATALVNQGRWADANQRFEEALKIDASNAQTLTNYADALAQQGRYEEAAARFEQALHINPNDAQMAITLTGYGNVLAQQGRLDRAFPMLEYALELRPHGTQMAISRNVYGRLLMQTGQHDKACAQFEQSLGLHLDRQTEVSTRFLYAVALQSLKRYNEAIAQLQQIQPEHDDPAKGVVVSIMQGRLFYITGQTAEGDKCFKRAQQQLESLGEAAGERDRARVALNSLQAAQAVFAQRPYSEQGWELLQQVGRESPRFGEAFRLMTLNASQEKLFEMMKPENPDPYDAHLLNRAVYHKIANEITILKSISQRMLMSARREEMEGLEKVEGLVEVIEQAEREIEQKRQKEKKELATIPADSYDTIIQTISETAHDIADNVFNKLFKVNSQAQRLIRRYEEGTKTRELLDRFLAQVKLSQTAVNNLKNVNEGIDIKKTTFQVAELFEKWQREPKLERASISLSIENGDKQMNNDIEKIRSMVSELVENAISHNPDRDDLQIGITSRDVFDPPELGVKFTSKKRYQKIIIEDDGRGVPKEKKGQIFLPLSTEEKGSHSGLGLYIIRRTLKEMGGYILETGKHGARFEMYIPNDVKEAKDDKRHAE